MTEEIKLDGPSPLIEVEADSLSILFDRINRKLVAGMPIEVTDPSLIRMAEVFRADREKFELDEAAGKRATASPRTKGRVTAKTPVKSVSDELDSFDDMDA